MTENTGEDKASYIAEIIKNKNSFLITTHVKPDGDGLGSSYALYHTLLKMGKRAVIVLDAPLPSAFNYIKDAEYLSVEQITNRDIDVIFTLDCANFSRTGQVGKFIRNHRSLKVTIDHHIPRGESDGDFIYLDSSACAVGEMVYKVLKKLGSLSLKAAEGIYLAIITDTGNFQFSNTSSFCHTISAEFIAQGVKPDLFHRYLHQTRSETSLRLLGAVLSSLEVHDRFAMLTILLEDIEKTGANSDAIEGFVNYALSIKGIEVGVLLEEKPDGLTRISLRSKSFVDVSKLASKYSGGGHKRAAGAHLKCGLSTAKRQIAADIKNAIESSDRRY